MSVRIQAFSHPIIDEKIDREWRTASAIVLQAWSQNQNRCLLFAMILSMDAPSLTPEESMFFDYTCDQCGAPVCERIQIMNLSLDYIEDLYCLACLARQQGLNQEELAETAKEYVQGRECFKTPWDNFAVQAQQCPLLKVQLCPCQDQSNKL